ncbi:MAG: hypothetical protein DMF62_04640 [Acidobacteria bacterium]|nr:MAG: hypothetical protein DMF62_04640 [Acidobacteriota bacterium]
MDDVFTVAGLIAELECLPPDAPVLITIVKYPQDSMRRDLEQWGIDWDEGDDVEVVPLEQLYMKAGLVHLCTELTDYSEERREYLDL